MENDWQILIDIAIYCNTGINLFLLPSLLAMASFAHHSQSNLNNPLLTEVVLHNTLLFLPLNSVLRALATSRDSHSIIVTSPSIRVGDSLSPDRVRLSRVLRRFERLAHVHVENAQLLVKLEDFRAFADAIPHVVNLRLTKLRLNRMTGGPFVDSFKRTFSNLRVLSLHGSMFPTSEVLTNMVSYINGKTLTSISLAGCRTLADQHVKILLAKCSLLTRLHLPDCTRLVSPSLIHNLVEEVNMSQCTSLESLPNINLPRVQHVSLQWCRKLSSRAVEQVVRSSSSLKFLNVGACVSVKQLHLESGRCLETVQLGMCESICELRVESCPELKNLHVGLCAGA